MEKHFGNEMRKGCADKISGAFSFKVREVNGWIVFGGG